MLESLTHDHFSGRVGEIFRIDSEPAALEFELISAEQKAVEPREGGRQPFSLVFQGPREPILEQRIRALQHEAFGTLEIFLVPIGQNENGVQYEAIFN